MEVLPALPEEALPGARQVPTTLVTFVYGGSLWPLPFVTPSFTGSPAFLAGPARPGACCWPPRMTAGWDGGGARETAASCPPPSRGCRKPGVLKRSFFITGREKPPPLPREANSRHPGYLSCSCRDPMVQTWAPSWYWCLTASARRADAGWRQPGGGTGRRLLCLRTENSGTLNPPLEPRGPEFDGDALSSPVRFGQLGAAACGHEVIIVREGQGCAG